jgi:hypothetical protein
MELLQRQRPAAHRAVRGAAFCWDARAWQQLWRSTPRSSTLVCGGAGSSTLAHTSSRGHWRGTGLRTLDLSSNNIGPDGARHLAATLERNSVLELWLRWNNIGVNGTAPFRTALERNNSRTYAWREQHRLQRCSSPGCGRGAKLHTHNALIERQDIGEAGAAALRAALETNCPLDRLYGSDVSSILKRNRGVHIARKQQVVPVIPFLTTHVPVLVVLLGLKRYNRASCLQVL